MCPTHNTHGGHVLQLKQSDYIYCDCAFLYIHKMVKRKFSYMMMIVVVRDINNGMPVACAGVNNDPIIVNLKSALGQGFQEFDVSIAVCACAALSN